MSRYGSYMKTFGYLHTIRHHDQYVYTSVSLSKYMFKNNSFNLYSKRSLTAISYYCQETKQNNNVTSRQLLYQYSRYNSTDIEPKESLFRKFRNIIDVFWYGCKALFTDVKLAVKTRRKLGLYHKQDLSRLTREEVRHLRQTKRDLVKTFPVTLLFMLPFIGYSAPLLAYFYPRQLLSQQFWHPDQKKEFILEEYEKRQQYYQPLVKEVGITAKEIKDKNLLDFCYKIIDGAHPSNNDLLSYQHIFASHDEFSLQKMPRYHLVKLCRCWLIPTAWYLPRWFLVNSLRKRVKYLQEDDGLIKRDGIDLLTRDCIEHAVHIRGLDETSLNDISMKYWLTEWIDLSTKVTDEDVSFLAHGAVFKAANFETMEKDGLVDYKLAVDK